MIVYTVVKHTEIERLTREGWKFEQIIAASRMDIARLSTPMVIPNTGGGGFQSHGTQELPVIVNEPLFMLSKDMDILTRENKLQALVYNQRKELAEAQTALAAAASEIERLTSGDALLRGVNQDALNALGVEQTMRRKLEVHLARVRAAIGELKFKEIVDAS